MERKSNATWVMRGARSLVLLMAVGTFFSISLSACMFIQSSTIGETTGSGTPVSVIYHGYGVLRLSRPRGLTSDVNAELVKQCQSGQVTDVQTQLSLRDWFLIVQHYTLEANAICKLAPLPPAPPPPPPVKKKVILRGVHFDFDKYNIRPADAAVLDEAAMVLKENPSVRVDVNGYTDAIGSVRYNLRLSEERARSVMSYLEKQGISASRLIPHGYGKSDFVATNKTKEGRAQNRRVELTPAQ